MGSDVAAGLRLIEAGLATLSGADPGCRFPGCDRPPQWTDAHHLIAWADGGPTNLDNILLLCRWHHTAVHEGGWTLHYDQPANTVSATRPDGQPLDLISRPRSRSPD